MSSSKNLEQKNTSFLTKSNSAFIENMYIRYIEKDPNLPLSWKDYFDTLNDDIKSVVKELEGPTWQPHKKRIKYESTKSTTKVTNNGSSEQSLPSSLPAALLIHNGLFLFSSKFSEYKGISISQVASFAIS